MTDIILASNNSPFDSIRHLDENKNEFWYARELMDVLAYKQWRRFNESILSAIENIEAVTGSSFQHFLPLQAKTKGRSKLDYKLSRLACYHVALCCDSRGNDSVKSAKHYFAIKTREAETVIPQQSERLKELELELAIAKANKATSENNKYILDRSEAITKIHGEQMLALLQGRPDAVVEKREIITETIICKNGKSVSFEGKSTAQVGRELGFKTGKEFERWLTKIGHGDLIFDGKRVNTAKYVPTEKLKKVKKLFVENRGNSRQLVIGE